MRNITLKAKDGTRIEATHYEQGSKKVVILAHGFFNAKDAYIFKEIAKALAVHYDVVSFDFRGHGKSSGLFTWTAKECADLQAVITYVKSCGYDAIGLMGFSLGAAIGLIETAQNPDIKTLNSPLPPAELFEKALAAAQSLKWNVVSSSREEGRIEATDETLWWGFKDDVVIRIQAEGAGSKLDIRSMSRVGKSDIGKNAERIRAFLAIVSK